MHFDQRNSTRSYGPVIQYLAFLAGLMLCSSCVNDPANRTGSELAEELSIAFVDSRECAECHPAEYEAWQGSHHHLAMQPASEGTVLADFNGSTFTHFGVTSRFFRRDGGFFVETEGTKGEAEEYEIKYTFGVEPLQQYLIEFPGGRLQCLTISWDTENEEWFHLYPDEEIEPGDELHWTGRYQNWNLMCAECHTTNLVKDYDISSDSYNTTYEEIGITCQACHGPGEAHVSWAREAAEGTADLNGADLQSYGLHVDFTRGDSVYEVESCAPCHSRRGRLTDSYRHTVSYHDLFSPQLLNEGLYFPDGQILDEVYVYGSFLQSKMYQQGVRCTNCHDPHTARVKADGNTICVQCHQPEPIAGFPTLKLADYDTIEHHFHEEGSEGSLCVNCHMPERTYMVVDPRRDHSFRIPRPDLSEKLETPNACTQCHQDKTADWAASRVREWYGQRHSEMPDYGEVIASARAREEGMEGPLTTLASDPNTAPIVRATLLELLGSYGEAGTEERLSALGDIDPLIRFGAARGLEYSDPALLIESLFPLLDDPSRRVRIEATRILLAVPQQLLKAYQKSKLERGRREYERSLLAAADMPSSNLNLGIMYQVLGELDKAEEAYERAIQMDSDFLPAYMNLANLYNQTRQNRKAENILRTLIRRGRGNGETHYSLGLILAEMGRLEEAARSLATASHLLPNRARIRYNYALTLQHLGRRQDAERALLESHRLDPEDTDILYALAIYYSQEENWARALEYARRLQAVFPEAPGPAQLVRELRSRTGAAD